MSKSIKSWYKVVNEGKYVGSGTPYCRSTWELAFCRFCDNNTNVVKWAHEPLKILYENPLTNKYTVYIPDFLVVYMDKKGKQHAELIEIKPAKEAMLSEAKSKRDQLRLAVNAAKWEAAKIYCKKHGLFFRIITEHELFNKP